MWINEANTWLINFKECIIKLFIRLEMWNKKIKLIIFFSNHINEKTIKMSYYITDKMIQAQKGLFSTLSKHGRFFFWKKLDIHNFMYAAKLRKYISE